MNFNTFEEILDFAIEREKQAADFYQDLAQKETFSRSRQTLLEFAAEEKKHQDLLEAFKKGNPSAATYAYEWIPDMKRSDYMDAVSYAPGMDLVEILRLAMKREESALRLYTFLASQTTDPACIRLFKLLAQEEARHKQTFETLYDETMAGLGD